MITQDAKSKWVEAEPIVSGYAGRARDWPRWMVYRFAKWLMHKTETGRVR